MADRFRADPVVGLGYVNEYVREADPRHHGYRQHHGQSGYPPSQPPVAEHSIADVASILGLPESVVTPDVLAAVTGLLAELDRLRWLDAYSARRLAELEGQAFHDPVAVRMLSRRGFMHGLAAFLRTGDGRGTLVVLHVAGIEALSQADGLAAGDEAIRHVASHLLNDLRASDVVGLLGGGDFAILMAGTELALSRRKIRQVMGLINAPPFTWAGKPHPFAMFAGYHVLAGAEEIGAEAALAAADRARRGFS